MKKFVIFTCLLLGACATLRPTPDQPASTADATRPPARPETPVTNSPLRPPAAARTAEQFDTTTAAERAKAAAAVQPAERALGRTVASLGTPTEPGFWLKTPLVKTESPGRVVYPATGKSSAVTLIPIDGPATAGSRLSLAAFRLIGAPLTELPEIEVFAGG